MNPICISTIMKCPHCFLELRITSQHNKEVDKCPECEGIWLGRDDLENILGFTGGDKKIRLADDLYDEENTIDENHDNKLENDYYYYKKPFKENEKLDDMFDFD